MKTITLVSTDTFKPLEILKSVLETDATGRGIQIPEQRRRNKVLNKIEAAEGADALQLEDADYDLVKSLYNVFPFGRAHADLIGLADAIDAATSE